MAKGSTRQPDGWDLMAKLEAIERKLDLILGQSSGGPAKERAAAMLKWIDSGELTADLSDRDESPRADAGEAKAPERCAQCGHDLRDHAYHLVNNACSCPLCPRAPAKAPPEGGFICCDDCGYEELGERGPEGFEWLAARPTQTDEREKADE